MTQQITFKMTTDNVKEISTYKIIRLMNLPKWAVLLGKILDENQYDYQMRNAEEAGIDIIIE